VLQLLDREHLGRGSQPRQLAAFRPAVPPAEIIHRFSTDPISCTSHCCPRYPRIGDSTEPKPLKIREASPGAQKEICHLVRMLSKTAAPGRMEWKSADVTEYCRRVGFSAIPRAIRPGSSLRMLSKTARRKPDFGQEGVRASRKSPKTNPDSPTSKDLHEIMSQIEARLRQASDEETTTEFMPRILLLLDAKS